MIDPDLIQTLPAEQQAAVREAIVVLVSTGLLRKQIERLLVRVAQGSDTEDKEKLMEKILDYRRQSHTLEALQQMGERFINGER